MIAAPSPIHPKKFIVANDDSHPLIVFVTVDNSQPEGDLVSSHVLTPYGVICFNPGNSPSGQECISLAKPPIVHDVPNVSSRLSFDSLTMEILPPRISRLYH
jgi:hypothetical protein